MQEKHHDTIHAFFHNFSRLIMLIPVVIVVIALLLKISKTDSSVVEKATPSNAITATTAPLMENKNIINLQGPSVCLYKSKEASWSAIIQNRMIWARSVEQMKTTDYILNGDCLYSWEKNKYTGEKICGIGQMLSIGESLFNSGLMNEDMFDSMLGKVKINIPLIPQYKDIQKIISSCRPGKTVPRIQFDLPKQVLFKSK